MTGEQYGLPARERPRKVNCHTRSHRNPKRIWFTRGLAECWAVLDQIRYGHTQYAYICDKCGWYHLTTKTKQEKA